jgi:hypothetical protein
MLNLNLDDPRRSGDIIYLVLHRFKSIQNQYQSSDDSRNLTGDSTGGLPVDFRFSDLSILSIPWAGGPA